ncbi:hypothetical protein [Nocardioides sp. W7]|uniref:hypothetical protein n=1 Tax=Nocardioides sp. W7 TaxID=2931390 RepID=UPI001FD47E60|nr:hypothetical protein [Nocardioides sp. W7]
MSERVLLHVGTPKTGTSYLQDVLFRNRPTLAEHGILYPAERFDEHFLAALDLMRLPWGGLEVQAVGAWDRLAAAVREHDGTAVVSHEILATASRSQADRALASLGHGSGTEVHLVLSVRDLVRQIPAEWQENLKHRSLLSYATFLEQIRDPAREGRIPTWFWGVQEVPDILDRWGHDLPPERIHLVTVPPPGGPRDLLWQRFSRVFGLDDVELDLEVERVNPSLGVPETALIRRINRAVNGELDSSTYRPLVRELLAHQTLSRRTRSPRLALPPDVHPWARDLQTAWVAEIRERGYDVVGDLDDLTGPPPPARFADPDAPSQRQVANAAVDAIRALLLENARRVVAEDTLRAELDEAHRALERSYLRPTYRWREKTVRRLQDGRLGTRLLETYRRARGRSSESA